MDEFDPTLRIALAVLATWRVTHLISSEDGPGDVMFHLRAKLGSSFAGKLMDCFYCLSLWVAAALAIMLTRHFMEWLLVWLALSGAACLLERATQERTIIQGLPTEGEDSHGMLRAAEGQPQEQSTVAHEC